MYLAVICESGTVEAARVDALQRRLQSLADVGGTVRLPGCPSLPCGKEAVQGAFPLEKLPEGAAHADLLFVHEAYHALERETLEKAIALHKESREPVISVHSPNDHPLQLRRMYAFKSADHIALLHDGTCPKNMAETHPFPFEWTRPQDDQSGDLFALHVDSGQVKPVSVERSGDLERCYFRKAGQTQASLVIEKAYAQQVRCVGLGLPGVDGRPRVLLCRDGERIKVVFADHQDVPDLLRLVPITAERQALPIVEIRTEGRRGTTLPFALDGLSGITCIGLDLVEDESFEHVEYFQEINTLHAECDPMKPVAITGRQCLPDVFIQVGAFLVTTGADLPRVCSAEAGMDFRGVELQRSELSDCFWQE